MHASTTTTVPGQSKQFHIVYAHGAYCQILQSCRDPLLGPPGHGSKINLNVHLSSIGKHWVKIAILWVTEKVMNFLPSNDLLLYPMGD